MKRQEKYTTFDFFIVGALLTSLAVISAQLFRDFVYVEETEEIPPISLRRVISYGQSPIVLATVFMIANRERRADKK